MDPVKILPVLIRCVAGVITIVLAKYILFSRRKKRVTLQDPTVKYPLKLKEKITVSHDTRKFRFELPSENHILGLPVGQHIYLSARIDGKMVARAYTPISSDDEKGSMVLVVKIYFRNVHPLFPDGGKMSQYLESLNIGESIDVRGPSGLLVYNKRGEFAIKASKNSPASIKHFDKVSMIAGGTGLTPMFQLITSILRDPKDHTQLALLYANQTEEDILLRDQLEEAAKTHPDRFKIWYTVDKPKPDWPYSSGFVNAEMIEANLFKSSDNGLVLMCGPPPMINFACNPSLAKLGFQQESIFAF